MITADAVVGFRPATEADRDQALALCAMASRPFDAFVWGSTARALEIAQYLWDKGKGDLVPATVSLMTRGAGTVGAAVCVRGETLKRKRLASAHALSNLRIDSPVSPLSDDERQHATLAASVMAPLGPNDWYIARIAVDPQFRGLGYGAKFLAHLLANADEGGPSDIVLEVAADNAAAIHVYEAHGFAPVVTRSQEGPGGRTISFLEMRRPCRKPA